MKILTEWTHEGVTYRTGDKIEIKGYKDYGYLFLAYVEGAINSIKVLFEDGSVDWFLVENVIAPKKKVPFEQRDHDNIMKIVSNETGSVLSIIRAGEEGLIYGELSGGGYEWVAENFTQLDGSSLYKEV